MRILRLTCKFTFDSSIGRIGADIARTKGGRRGAFSDETTVDMLEVLKLLLFNDSLEIGDTFGGSVSFAMELFDLAFSNEFCGIGS